MRVFAAACVYAVDRNVFYPPEIYRGIIPVVSVKRDKVVFGMPVKIFNLAVYRSAVYVQPVGETILEF